MMNVKMLIFLLLSLFGLCTSQNKESICIVSTPFFKSIYKVGLIIPVKVFTAINPWNLEVGNGRNSGIVAKSIYDWAFFKLEVDGIIAQLASFMEVVDSFKSKK
ncbi:hypothetical protein [Chondrinema litorale]|uniref:hypothetical protein n=1 Tax=Chondrinema litorale TaxID=2994555 RepID=UPI002542A85B|nr:hypothetical protein [Chondrinema litorale]UZR98353.1 hypothetical protein OQ292_30610 [Chondrinema litorale]